MEPKQKESLLALFQSTSSSLRETDPEWVKIVADFSLEELSAANGLTERERMICILSVLLGCQGMGEYRHMLHAGLDSGLDPIAIKETLDQAAAYLGIGRVHNFLEATNQIMEQHGVTIPLLPQGTTDEASRFAKGLKKQMELFGKDIAKQQTDCPSLRRNINHWLADNCFGDD